MTLSFASSTSDIVTTLLFFLVNKADSLIRFAKSAPEKPGVPLAIVLSFTSGLCLFLCELKIASLPIYLD